MYTKPVITIVLLAFVAVSVGYLVVSETRTASPARPAADAGADEPGGATIADGPSPESAVPGAAAPAHRVIAYYFHNAQRCATCLKIEMLSEEALRERFPEALAAGALEWRVVNMQEAPNLHFVDDYQLVASSLVLVDLHDGAQRAWITMENVWQLVHGDEAAFKEYVAAQAREYLESSP